MTAMNFDILSAMEIDPSRLANRSLSDSRLQNQLVIDLGQGLDHLGSHGDHAVLQQEYSGCKQLD